MDLGTNLTRDIEGTNLRLLMSPSGDHYRTAFGRHPPSAGHIRPTPTPRSPDIRRRAGLAPPPDFANDPGPAARWRAGRASAGLRVDRATGNIRTCWPNSELHGLVLTLVHAIFARRHPTTISGCGCIIVFFAGISAAGAGLALRNVSKTSELQIRLVRASELNSHLKEMNLAAAGLAHETRNPLNIIRGLAQMISKQPDAPPDIREKSRVIMDETDKVTAQLNEFINYSRPREVRRSKVALNAAVAEVVRTLNHDIEEKKLRVETGGEPLDHRGRRTTAAAGPVQPAHQRDPGRGRGRADSDFREARKRHRSLARSPRRRPRRSAEQRQEIFKPYFTTHQKGTGLGLAVVQQIVLAHGWEIQCLANEPKGAIFRITHLKLAA